MECSFLPRILISRADVAVVFVETRGDVLLETPFALERDR